MPAPMPPFGMPPAPAANPKITRMTSEQFATDLSERMDHLCTHAEQTATQASTATGFAVARRDILNDTRAHLTHWQNTQNREAKALQNHYGQSVLDASLAMQKTADGACPIETDEEREVKREVTLRDAAVHPLNTAAKVLIDRPERRFFTEPDIEKQRLQFNQEKTTRDGGIVEDLRNDFSTQYERQTTQLKDSLAAIQQTIRANPHLSQDEKDRLDNEATNLFNEVQDNYSRLHQDRVANAEALFNSPRTQTNTAAGARPTFSRHGDFLVDINRSQHTPIKDGDSLIVPHTKFLVKDGDNRRPQSPKATMHQTSSGFYPTIDNISQYKIQQGSYKGVTFHTSQPTGTRYLTTLVDAIQGARARDPMMPIDIKPILNGLSSDADAKEFIERMVKRFGNVPMGIEGDDTLDKYKQWKQDYVQQRGLNVDLGGGTALAPRLSSGASADDSVNIDTPNRRPTLTITAASDSTDPLLSASAHSILNSDTVARRRSPEDLSQPSDPDLNPPSDGFGPS